MLLVWVCGWQNKCRKNIDCESENIKKNPSLQRKVEVYERRIRAYREKSEYIGKKKKETG